MMHTPVLLQEVISLLDPKSGKFFIDGTFGAGGHSKEILEKIGPTGRLLAVDWDDLGLKRNMIDDPRITFHVGNYADLPEILKEKNWPKADGLLLDLGFSSEQLDLPIGGGRGFSFQKDEPLLMTYSDAMKPAKEILREISEEELMRVIKEYSQEKFARKIARAIKDRVNVQPMETTRDLVEAILSAVPNSYERGHNRHGGARIHPATRTFQALRIYVNHELDNLRRLLERIGEVVGSGGRVAIISFHSLEDRMVKNYFRMHEKVGKLKILTKKPVGPKRDETRINPRARSAKLRVAQIS